MADAALNRRRSVAYGYAQRPRAAEVRECQDAGLVLFDDPPTDAAVRTTLRTLVAKGHVRIELTDSAPRGWHVVSVRTVLLRCSRSERVRPSTRVLLDLAESTPCRPRLIAALPMVQRSRLEMRLMAILKAPHSPTRRLAVVPVLMVGLFTLAVAAAQPGLPMAASALDTPACAERSRHSMLIGEDARWKTAAATR